MSTTTVTNETIDRLLDRLPIDEEIRPAPKQVKALISLDTAALMTRSHGTEQAYLEAVKSGAPMRVRLQLARELVAIRVVRVVGQAAAAESARLTEAIVNEAAHLALYSQVLLDGLAGKVDDTALQIIGEIRDAGLQGLAGIQISSQQALLERVHQFKSPSSDTSGWDVFKTGLFGWLPSSRILDG